MKSILRAAAFAGALAAAAAPALATDVGVSIAISQPGVYGRVDIGRYPQPQLVLPQPVLVAPPPAVVVRPEPVYLWVPYEHRRAWPRYCGRYGACGVPVYFVQHGWYREHVHGGPTRHGPSHGRGRGKGH